MDDHKLRVFCTVAEVKSFSKASEIIHLTQPAVSLQIQALEEFYETKLLNRTSSRVSLTPPGEVLYQYAKEILSLYADAEKNIGKLTGLIKGSIVIGASPTIGNYILPRVIADFRKVYPRIKVNLFIRNTRRIAELLVSSNIDIGLIEGEVKSRKITVESLLEDELYVIIPSMHSWSKRSDISLDELLSESFILREEGSGTRVAVERALMKHGVSPQQMNLSLILGSNEAIIDAVEDRMGVSILSSWTVRKEIRCGSIEILRIKEERITREFSLIFNRRFSPSHDIEALIHFIRSYNFEDLTLQ